MPSAGFFDDIPGSTICTYYYVFFLLDVIVFFLSAAYLFYVYTKIRGQSLVMKAFMFLFGVALMSLSVFNSGFRYQVCNRTIGGDSA
jgi:hypothetical protein